MEVAIIGAGYVGLVTGAGLASLGHRVRLGEANTERVDLLKKGGMPIFEEGLAALLEPAVAKGQVTFHVLEYRGFQGRWVHFPLPSHA